MKRGSDTCVFMPSQYSMWDTFYIGVRCIQPCNYTLSTYYFTPQVLNDSIKTQV